MSLSRAEVELLLGRLQLTPAELDLIMMQLTPVVGYIEQLKELNTDNVEPTTPCRPRTSSATTSCNRMPTVPRF